MDWLTFKFCVIIWVLSVSKSQSQLLNSTSISNQLQSACQEGQPVTSPDECNSCICFAQRVHCTNLTCPEQECNNGDELLPPDACNTCICRRGKVTCTNMICIPAPGCAEKQLYPSQNKCNACMCINGFITCTSNGCSEENLPAVVPSTTTKTPKKTTRCTEGSLLAAPMECLECYCENGRKRCKYICNQTVQMETRFADTSEPACFTGQTIHSPDDCNHCLCFEGEIHCTHRPCQTYMRIGRQCGDEQMVIQFDDCNECYCIEGQLECSNLVCIRGSKCVEGQEIPKPDTCNACVCVDGHIVCTNSECPLPNPRSAIIPERTTTELKLNDECQDGDVIPTLPSPYDCNKCFCNDNIIMCTMNSCEDSKPEINGRLKEQNEQTDLKNFDKQISVEPFIDELYKNKDKLPSKIIHTHAYNGYQQEIKVHAKHLPKDATNLFKVLATSLDNSALASIGQKLLTSSDSLSNNPDLKIPFGHQEVQNNLLGEGNVLTTQSNKIITSGSQSNETILVIPNTEPFDYENTETTLPLTNKHETIWKAVSAPAPIIYHNNQPIKPRYSKVENLNFYNDDPSFLTSIPQNDMIRKPTKFSRPGIQSPLPTRDILELPNVNAHSNPILNPKPINIYDGKINYVPYYPDNNQFKPIPSGFVGKGDALPQRPLYEPTKPTFIAPNINGIQQKPLQSQYVPNLSKYYPNQVKPQEFQLKPNQNQPNQVILPSSNTKGIQIPPLSTNTPNQPLVSTNQYNSPQFGLKPGQGSPLNNIGNQTNHHFNQFPSNFPMNPPVINLPLKKKRITSIESEGSKEIPAHTKIGPNTTLPAINILNPQQNGVSPEHTQFKPTHSQFVPNPSIYYKNEFEAPKINEVNSEEEQLMPNSNYDQPHASSELDNETNIPKVRNKKIKYNTTHSHYEKHSTVIYVSENDPNDPDHPKIVGHDPNEDQDAPHINAYKHNVPNQDSQELDLTILQLGEKDPHSELTNNSTERFFNLPNDGKKTDQIGSNQNRINPTIPGYPNVANYPHNFSQFIKEGLNGPGFADRSPANSVKDLTHQKTTPQIGSIQNQNQPGVLNDRGSTPGFQYVHNAYEDPRQLKPVHKLSPANLQTLDNNYFSGILDERGSDDGFFQYPSNSAEDLSHPKQNLQKPTHTLYGPAQNQHLPGMFDERGSAGGFQYPSQSAKDPSHPIQNIQKPTKSLYGPTQNQINKSSHFVPYTSNFDPAHPKDNLHIPPHPQFGPTQNKLKPGMLDNRGVKDGYQYGHNANQNPTHLKPSFNFPNIPFDPTLHQHKPGTPKGLQHPKNSAENLFPSRGFVYTPPQPTLGPPQIPHLLGIFKEPGSNDSFHNPSNSAENPSHSIDKLNKPLQTQFAPTQNQPILDVLDNRGSAGGMQHPSNSAEQSIHPKDSKHNPSNPKENLNKLSPSPFGSTQNQLLSNFHYSPQSIENPLYPKLKQPYSLNGPTQNQHLPGMFDERGSAGGFQYPSHSTDDSSHPKQNIQKPTNTLYGPSQTQKLPGIFDERGSTSGFQNPSHSAENPSHPKQTNSLYGPAQNQHLPGMFDERGSAGGFQYPSHSTENPTQAKQNIHKPTHSLYGPMQNQQLPGMFDERGSADGFQYPSHSAEDPSHPKQNIQKPTNILYGPTQNQHLPGMFDERGSASGFQYPSHSAENLKQAKQNIHKPTHSLYGPMQNQQLPGMFDERGSADGFQYPSHSAEDPSHPKQNIQKPTNILYGPTQNQQLPGMFDERGSASGFQYPSHSAENPTQAKQNIHKPTHSLYGPMQNQQLPGMFDERGSADGFQYPSHSAEDPSHPKQNIQKPTNSLYDPTQKQNLPGTFDERGSADDFQYPSHSAENPSHPKQTNSLYGPTQKQHLPGMFDERGSADGFQYPSHSGENPSHPKQTNSLYGPTQKQHLPGMFDERGSADGFQYPSHFSENPSHQKQTNSLYGPTQNQHLPGMFDERGSDDGFQYPSHSAENPSHPKQTNSLYDPTQNKHLPGIFDERGSDNGFQYPSHSAENPSQPNQNIQKPTNSLYGPSQNQHLPGMFDERGSADGFHYPSHSAEDPTHPKGNSPHSPLHPVQSKHLPGMFDEPGSATGFQYPSNSVQNPLQTKDNHHQSPQSQFLPLHNHYKENKQPNSQFGPTNGFQYLPHSAENLLQSKDNHYPPDTQVLPTQNQYKENLNKQPNSPSVPMQNTHNSQFDPTKDKHLPGMFDERGSADGFQYISNSAEDPDHHKNDPDTTSDSKLKQSQNQPEHSSLDDSNKSYSDKAENQPDKISDLHPKNSNYNNNNPLRPWIHLDHDQYKPSSFDNLLNGIHNIPWSDPDDHKEVSNIVTTNPQTRFEHDRDQYKPSSFDNLLNGVHNIPWPILNYDNDVLGTDAEITTPHAGFKPKQDPSLPISNQNDRSDQDELQTEQDIPDPFLELTNPHPEIKPESGSDNDRTIDDGKIPDYYDQLYPLFKAVKKLSEPPIDDSVLSVDQHDLLPYLFPGITKIPNFEQVEDQDYSSTVEDRVSKGISPLSKLKTKLKQLPQSGTEIFNWLENQFNKLVPTKYNVTVIKNDIDMTKIFHLLKNLTRPSINDNAILQNIPLLGYNPEILKNIINDFQEDILTTTPSDGSDPTVSEESRPQAKQTNYPDVHIILHQPFDEDYTDIPPYTPTDGAVNRATDMGFEGLDSPLFSKIFNPRFKHRPKDQKDECGHGTNWISKCHGCSCYFGRPMCFKMHDCELRPFGQPMTCKPYSHFNLGCYTCECNGDGVAECDSSDCNTEPSGKSKDTTEPPIPVFNEFFDSKKTTEILQYFNFFKKLPKDCPKQDLQAQYPTCERGTSWVSSCHKCECNESGKHECVKIDDCELDFDSYGKPGRCKPNSKFYPKTNSMPCVECTCNDEGNPYCPTADYKKH